MILDGRQEEVQRVMTALLDGYGGLAKLRDGVLRRLKTLPHGHEDEEVALRISRACNHLSLVMADIPMKMFEVGVAGPIAASMEGERPREPLPPNRPPAVAPEPSARRWFCRRQVPA